MGESAQGGSVSSRRRDSAAGVKSPRAVFANFPRREIHLYATEAE